MKDTVSYYDYDDAGNDGWVKDGNTTTSKEDSKPADSSTSTPSVSTPTVSKPEVIKKDFKINGNKISKYKIVVPLKDGDYTTNNAIRVQMLAQLLGIEVRPDSSNASDYEIIVGTTTRARPVFAATDNKYYATVKGNKLYIDGGSADAMGAAIEAVIEKIKAQNSFAETQIVDGKYTGSGLNKGKEMSFLETFDFNMAAGVSEHSGNNPYYNFFNKDPYDWFLEDTSFRSANVWAKNGSLVLDAKGKENVTFGGVTKNVYSGAEIRGRYFTYGYAEIRAKLNVSDGICPAFWLLGNGEKYDKYYEIDVFEGLGTSAINNGNAAKGSMIEHTIANGSKSSLELRSRYEILINGKYVKRTETNDNKLYIKGFLNDGKFHTYAVEWSKDYIYWIYDGVRVMRLKLEDGECATEMCPILTVYSNRNIVDRNWQTGSAAGLTDKQWAEYSSMEVDYIMVTSKAFS